MIEMSIKYKIIKAKPKVLQNAILKYLRLAANIKRWIILLFFIVLNNNALATGISPYSTNELDELEKEFIQLINQSDSVIRNPLANEYLNHLGKQLASQARIKNPSLFIVRSKEINAFAGPGGYIGVNSQLILMTTNESELAGVLAHEIAHVRLHHLYSSLEHQKQMRIPMLASILAAAALSAINPTLGLGAMMGSMSGITQDRINFTRLKEKEADRIGIDQLIKAGFNPNGMVTFFKKMQESSRYYYTANVPAILRTHPLDHERIAEAENRVANLVVKKHIDSLEYSLFKEIIRTSAIDEYNQLLSYYNQECPRHNAIIVCHYGKALTLLHLNNPEAAYDLLSPLILTHRDNLFLQIAIAQAEIALTRYPEAINRLSLLQTNYPDNYAALMAYAQGLIEANQATKATAVLLKGSRIYPKDLTLCRELARAQARANQKSYAYFTQAQCLLLEGQKNGAVALLKTARNLAKKDAYLCARIDAKMEEIKSEM